MFLCLPPSTRSSFFILVSILCAPGFLHSESWRPTIDEASITHEIYVDASAPVASSDGSKAKPYTSILAANHALQKALNEGTPTRLRIAPGVYRGSIRHMLFAYGGVSETWQETPFILEGYGEGEVILSGSVTETESISFQASSWQPVEGADDLYTNEWPFEKSVDAGPWINTYGFAMLTGLMQRSESVWLDGRRVRQVLAESYRWEDPDGPRGVTDHGSGKGGDGDNLPGTLVFDSIVNENPAELLADPWTFCVYTDPNAPDDLRGKVFLRLPEGQPIEQFSRIEVGEWIKGFNPVLGIRKKHNFIVRNLVIEHGTMAPLISAFTINECENFILQNVTFRDNGSGGLAINNSNRGAVLDCTAIDNGTQGFSMGNSRKILFEGCKSLFNNYRGGWSGWLSWHPSGFKSGDVHDIVIRDYTAIGNYANGLWFDVYCTNVLVEDSFFLGNRRMGLMFELTRPNGGPQVARNCVFAFNDNTGVFVSMAANTTVENCLFVNNGGRGNVEGETKNTQLLFKFRDHPTGPVSASEWERVTLNENVFISNDSEATLVDYLTVKSDPENQYERVLRVLRSDSNSYSPGDPYQAFRMPSGEAKGLEDWRRLQDSYRLPGGRDANSVSRSYGLNPIVEREFRVDSDSEVSRMVQEMGIDPPDRWIGEYWSRVEAGLYHPPHLFYEKQVD